MPQFSLGARGIATGTTPGTYKTLVGLKLANTTGHRIRLNAVRIDGDAVAPQDLQVTAKIAVTDNTTDGTSTAATSDIMKKDSGSLASNVTAGKNYTAEPTTYGRETVLGGFNTRGGLEKVWLDKTEMPVVGPNETLGIMATIGSGSTAATLSVSANWEEF